MQKSIALDSLNQLVERALHNLGIEKQERDIIRRVLMYAEMRGSSQGLIKIKERTVLPDDDCTEIQIENKLPSISRVDGGGHTGMFVLHKSVEVAIQSVMSSGIALVSTHNTRSSTGAIGFYANEIAESGFIALVLAGSPKVMAIEGGIDPVFGTNPIAIALPTETEPLVLDMATAATTWFAVINARDHKKSLPANAAVSKIGEPTTSPSEAMKGALRAFGGVKGSGLALMFEFLTGVLGNASLLGEPTDNRSNTIIAIDPEAIEPGFQRRASRFIAELKASRPDKSKNSNNSGIRLPGERSNKRAATCVANNEIAIDSQLLQHLTDLAERNAVKHPQS